MPTIKISKEQGQCTGFLTRYCRLPEGHEGDCSYVSSQVEHVEHQLSRTTDKWNKAALRAEHAEAALESIRLVAEDAIRRGLKISGKEVGDDLLFEWVRNRATLRPEVSG